MEPTKFFPLSAKTILKSHNIKKPPQDSEAAFVLYKSNITP